MKTKIKIFFEILFHKEINDINNIHMDKERPCSNITLFMDKRDNGTFLNVLRNYILKLKKIQKIHI